MLLCFGLRVSSLRRLAAAQVAFRLVFGHHGRHLPVQRRGQARAMAVLLLVILRDRLLRRGVP